MRWKALPPASTSCWFVWSIRSTGGGWSCGSTSHGDCFQGDVASLQFRVNSKTLYCFELCACWTTNLGFCAPCIQYFFGFFFLFSLFRWNAASVAVKRAPACHGAPAYPGAPPPSDHPAFPTHGHLCNSSVPPPAHPASTHDPPFLILPRMQRRQRQLRAARICTPDSRSSRPRCLQQPIQPRDRGGQS